MTPEELAAIKALLGGNHGTYVWYPLGEAQLLALVAEIERLQSENRRLSEGVGQAVASLDRNAAMLHEAKARINANQDAT